jgi:hypothetical protein
MAVFGTVTGNVLYVLIQIATAILFTGANTSHRFHCWTLLPKTAFAAAAHQTRSPLCSRTDLALGASVALVMGRAVSQYPCAVL